MTVTSRSYFIGYLPLANISRAQEVTERVFKELVSLLTRKRRKKLNTVRRANLLIGENSNMSGIPADVIGETILKMLTKYPQLFTSNYTLADIFTFVRLNTTILSIIVNATGVEGQTIEEAIDLYLTVAQYLQPTRTATPPTNETNR